MILKEYGIDLNNNLKSNGLSDGMNSLLVLSKLSDTWLNSRAA